jgi:hypothetical protein
MSLLARISRSCLPLSYARSSGTSCLPLDRQISSILDSSFDARIIADKAAKQRGDRL